MHITPSKQHTIPEDLVLPAAVKMQVLLSADISSLVQFVAFVSYNITNGTTEDILFCTWLEDKTSGNEYSIILCKELINTISTCCYMRHWCQSYDITSAGLIVVLKEIKPNATWLKCFLHRGVLSHSLPSEIVLWKMSLEW